MQKFILISVLVLVSQNLFAQGTALPMPVNTPLTSESCPSISGNGKTLVFLANTGEDGANEIVISYQKGSVWTRPETVPGINSAANKLNYTGGACISFDGTIIFFASNRYGGVGSNDIWYIEKTAAGWSAPKNPGKPLNTDGAEGDPCLSPDGKTLFFTRREVKKGPNGQFCSKIYMTERAGKDTWKEPIELPASINSGCEASPRMSGDNKTLFFSSIRTGGKGGFDLYRTQLTETGTWTNPAPLSFLNTAEDDIYISIPATGTILYNTASAKQGTDIYRTKIPDNLQPEKVLILQGAIRDSLSSKGISGKVYITALPQKKQSIIPTTPDGSFVLFLMKGRSYDVSATSMEKGFSFQSFYFPDTISTSQYKNMDFKIKNFTASPSFYLREVKGLENSLELDRAVRFLNENPVAKIEINTTYKIVVPDTSITTTTDSLATDSSAIKPVVAPPVESEETKNIQNYLLKKGINANRITLRRIDVAEDKDVNKIAIKIKN